MVTKKERMVLPKLPEGLRAKGEALRLPGWLLALE
jgi:hypothetical protein